jgi:hypothetical protein
MLKRITTSRVVASQLALGVVSSALLALVIHFPDVAHRPMPPPGKLLLALIIVITAGIIALGGAGVQSANARTGVAIIFHDRSLASRLVCFDVRVDQHLWHMNASNQAMQRSAGRCALQLPMTSTFNLQLRTPSPAVADLVSR